MPETEENTNIEAPTVAKISFQDDPALKSLYMIFVLMLKIDGATADSLEKLETLVRLTYESGYLKGGRDAIDFVVNKSKIIRPKEPTNPPENPVLT